jgi:hypothetical protein
MMTPRIAVRAGRAPMTMPAVLDAEVEEGLEKAGEDEVAHRLAPEIELDEPDEGEESEGQGRDREAEEEELEGIEALEGALRDEEGKAEDRGVADPGEIVRVAAHRPGV